MRRSVKMLCPALLIALLTVSFAFSQETSDEFYQRAMEIMNSGRYVEALPFLDQALRLNSNNVAALLARSRAKSNNQRDMEGAMADLETLLQLDPSNGEAFFERAMLKNSLIGDLIEKNGGRMRTEDLKPFFEAVLDDVDFAISNGYKNFRTYEYRASFLMRHFGEYRLAINDLNEALVLEPERSQILMERSRAKREIGDISGAIEDLKLIIDRFDFVKNKAEINDQLMDRAKSDAKMALNALAYIFTMNEQPDMQIWALEKSIEIEPNWNAYVSLARHKMIFGTLDEAIVLYTKAIDLPDRPPFGITYMDRGIVYLLQGKTLEAEQDFEKGREVDPRLKNYNLKYWLELARRQRDQQKVKVELPTSH